MIESKLIQTSIREIRKTLEAFAACPKTQEKLCDARYNSIWHTGYWTKNVIHRIGCIGKKDFEVYSEFHPHRYSAEKGWQRVDEDKKKKGDKGEWGYDLCWVEEGDKTRTLPLTKSLSLALECEWHKGGSDVYRSEIEFDFEKLLRSCAALRVMIFECWCPKEPVDTVIRKAKEEIKNLICRIKAFSGSQSEANYLFCVHCTYKGGNKFIFCTYPPTTEN